MGLIFVRYDFRPKAVLMHIHCRLTVKTAETLAAKDAVRYDRNLVPYE